MYCIIKYLIFSLSILILFSENIYAQVGKSVKGDRKPITERFSPFSKKKNKERNYGLSLSSPFSIFSPKGTVNSRKITASSSISYAASGKPLNLRTLKLMFISQGSYYATGKKNIVFSTSGLFEAFNPDKKYNNMRIARSGSVSFSATGVPINSNTLKMLFKPKGSFYSLNSKRKVYSSGGLFETFNPDKNFSNVRIARSGSVSFSATGVPINSNTLKMLFKPKGSFYSLNSKRKVYSSGGLFEAYNPDNRFRFENFAFSSPFGGYVYTPTAQKNEGRGFNFFAPDKKYNNLNIARSGSVSFSATGVPINSNTLKMLLRPKGSFYSLNSKRKVYSSGGLFEAFNPDNRFRFENFAFSSPFGGYVYTPTAQKNEGRGFSIFASDKKYNNLNIARSGSVSFAATGIPVNSNTLKMLFRPKGSFYSLNSKRKVYSSGGLFQAYQSENRFMMENFAFDSPFSLGQYKNKFANPFLSNRFKVFSPENKFRLENFALGSSPFNISSAGTNKNKIRISGFQVFVPDKKFSLENFVLNRPPFGGYIFSSSSKNKAERGFSNFLPEKSFSLENFVIKGNSPFAGKTFSQSGKNKNDKGFGIFQTDKKFSIENLALSSLSSFPQTGIPLSRSMLKTLFFPKGSSYTLHQWGKQRRVWSSGGLFYAYQNDNRFLLENFIFGSPPFTYASISTSKKSKKSMAGFKAYLPDSRFLLENFVLGGGSPFGGKIYLHSLNKKLIPRSMGFTQPDSHFSLEGLVLSGASPFAGKSYYYGGKKKIKIRGMGNYQPDKKFQLDQFVLGGGSPFSSKAFFIKTNAKRAARGFAAYQAEQRFLLENFALGGASPFTSGSRSKFIFPKKGKSSNLSIFVPSSTFNIENFVIGSGSPFAGKISGFQFVKQKISHFARYSGFNVEFDKITIDGTSPFTKKEAPKQKFKTTGTGFEEKGRRKKYTDKKFTLFKRKKLEDGLPYVMQNEKQMYSKSYVRKRDKQKENIFDKKMRNHYKIK